MNQKIIYKGVNENGRMIKTLIMDGYEYFLIEPKESTRGKCHLNFPNFQNTGMALCGIRKLKKNERKKAIENTD